jgi:DNA primase
MVDMVLLRADHSLGSVLRRCGIDVPDPGPGIRDEWRCHCPLPSHPLPVDIRRHKPSFAVHIAGRMAGRWHCFACDTGGDVVQFVEYFAQVDFRQAVRLIESGGAIPRGADPHLQLRPATRTATGGLFWEAAPGSDREAPDPGRTSPGRLLDAMREAWHYYTLPIPARLARNVLARREIDVAILESREGRPAAGHTPQAKRDADGTRQWVGLVEYLRRRGFTDDELVDAGLVSRHPDGSVTDLFRLRLVLPVRDGGDRIVGFIARDVSGGDRPKYLNSPATAIYDKSRLLYRPGRATDSPASNLVVVEGALDALAIEAAAADARTDINAVSPSGVALTSTHRAQILALTSWPPVLCADGDAAGRAATAQWVTDLTREGREVVALTLPDPWDPAAWLAQCGHAGLMAFVRQGCLNPAPNEIRPVHAGRYLAQLAAQRNWSPDRALAELGVLGAGLHSHLARARFAEQAGGGLASAGWGPDGWLERTVASHVSAALVTDRGSRLTPPSLGMTP